MPSPSATARNEGGLSLPPLLRLTFRIVSSGRHDVAAGASSGRRTNHSNCGSKTPQHCEREATASRRHEHLPRTHLKPHQRLEALLAESMDDSDMTCARTVTSTAPSALRASSGGGCRGSSCVCCRCSLPPRVSSADGIAARVTCSAGQRRSRCTLPDRQLRDRKSVAPGTGTSQCKGMQASLPAAIG